MRSLENFKPTTLWLFSVFLLLVILAIPGSPFTFSVFIPVVACRLFPRYKLEIMFSFAVFFGIAITQNFFSQHLYSYSSNDPSFIIFGAANAVNAFGYKDFFLNALGVALYFFIFIFIFKLFKLFYKKINLASSVFLSAVILVLVWMAQSLSAYKNNFTFIVSLSVLMLSRHAFYLFNYVRFFDRLPRNRHEFFAMIQPFWFLTSAAPENPIYQIEKSEGEILENLRSAFYILTTCLLFKLFLIIYMTGLNLLLTKNFLVIYNDSALVNTLLMSIFRNWRVESALTLILCIFSCSISYLGSTFFVYGRVGVAMARLCGFNLPDYINSPWRSHSFADFFSRMMYYYNIIIINHFFYPALEFLRRYNISRRARVFIGLNWALIFGGFISHFLKDNWKVYKFGFFEALTLTSRLAFPAIIVLSLAVTLSLYLENKSEAKKTNVMRMFFYIFLYSLIMPLNFSIVFGNFSAMVGFYTKIFTLGLFQN
ncbi:MAG: hypothetical protein WC635_06845 [Bacteriovorax sp.]|jgi:hypothetical protein